MHLELTLDIAIVEHSKLLEKFQDSDLIQADKGYKIYYSLPQRMSFNVPPIPLKKIMLYSCGGRNALQNLTSKNPC